MKPREDGYQVVPNPIIDDERLSYADLGLLVKMLSHSDSFWHSATRLKRRAPGCGRDAIRKSMRRLEAFGYLDIAHERDADGRITTQIYVTELGRRAVERWTAGDAF